ncbi:MAG: GNAT family N-acetyltransferase [Candidatus Thermoplasmatota archaeon]|jgi:RimJ/RimL family protein N-acetyltransferase|nr:GNAT family N-acetyltransferase [Candidatus Thermoplasmatota archaeon]
MRVWPALPITTERLSLRPLEMKDAPEIVNLISSREMVMYTLMIPFPYSLDDALSFIVNSKRSFMEGTALNLAIVPKDTLTLSGVIGLMGFEPNHNKAKVGYWLAKDLWGKGYVVEGLSALADYAFGPLRLHKLEAHIFEPNHRSKRVLEKAHFRYEGRLRDHYLKDGQYFDALAFSLLSTDLVPK